MRLVLMFSFLPFKRALIAAALVTAGAMPLAAAEVVMVDQAGCYWCEQWDKEIGPIYPKTTEGKFAPLRKVDIRDVADEIELTRRVGFTPTFLLVDDGVELARVEGYPGEDFFWPLIDQMLRAHTDYDPTTPEP